MRFDVEGKIRAWIHTVGFTLTDYPIDRFSDQPTVHRSESPLFEPMDENASPENASMSGDTPELQEDDQSSLPPYMDNMNGLSRARIIKSHVSKSLRILGPKSTRSRARSVEEDPENHLIKTLRQDHNMNWDAISALLNKERLEHGEPQSWTAAAVYSRFVRNAPRIAAAQGEVGFNPKDCK